jgi:predicted metal-dependent hydrolase
MNPGFFECLGQGVTLFNQQEFYEAHEAWEAGWMDELGDERTFLQGLIQVAAGFYKLQVGSPVGTQKLLEQGSKKLRSFVGRSLGVDLESLLPTLDVWIAEAKVLAAHQRADYDPKRLPKLSYRPPTH